MSHLLPFHSTVKGRGAKEEQFHENLSQKHLCHVGPPIVMAQAVEIPCAVSYFAEFIVLH